MSENTFQDMTREYFIHLDRLNKNDLNNYIVGLIHSSIINQCNWFLSRPMNQFHLERAINNHAGATRWNNTSFQTIPSPYASVVNYDKRDCYCWYQLSLQVIELLFYGRQHKTVALPLIQLPHTSEIKSIHEIAELLGLFRFMS